MSEQTTVREVPNPSPSTQPGAAGLRLTHLTLAGFKSFADKTVFTFDDPVTGIVGPNGCGKSNVVDAIKWVLGERSSKSLRGKEMIDVIFAGSAGRKPGGLASVTLSFVNPENGRDGESENQRDEVSHADASESETHPTHDLHISDDEADHAADEGEDQAEQIIAARGRIHRPLPIDTEVVEVERRLYRDGKSQYLINGRLARLRDIRELFLDTGIGADAYSIIEQGKVDAMLLASPVERRAIFEEAAGIAKYRTRRVEAERKLDKTEVNLTRTREQLAGTERRLRIVRGQAAKAKRYIELDTEYRATRTALAFDQYDELRQRLDGLTSQLAGLEIRKNETHAELVKAESAHQDAEIARHECSRARRAIGDDMTASRHESEQADQRRAMAESAAEDADRQTAVENDRLEQAAKQAADLDSEIEDLLSSIAALGEQLADAERSMDGIAGDRTQAQEAIATRRAELGDARAHADSIHRERLGLVAQIDADQRRAESISEQIAQFAERFAAITTERTELTAAISHQQTETADTQRRADALRDQITALDKHAGNLGADRGQLARTVAELDERFVRLDSRRQTLHEMVASRAGLGEAARTVLDAAERDDAFSGVIGSLAELIETDAEHAPAIEAALGSSLEAIVVRSMAEMPTAAEIASLPGRVAFLPIQPLDGSSPSDADRWQHATNGRVRGLRSMVRSTHDTNLDALLDRLLGKTALVAHIDAALMLAAGPMAGWRFVTHDGTVVEPDGRVSAGPASGESTGLITRQSELADLHHQLDELGWVLGAQRARLEQADSHAARLEADRADLAAQLATAERKLVTHDAAIERQRTDALRLQRDADGFTAESDALRIRLGGVERDRRDMAERAERLERLETEQRGLVERLEREVADTESTLNNASEQLASARVTVGRLGEQVQASRRDVGRLERSRDDAERARDEASRQTESARQRAAHHKNTAQEAAKLIKSSEQLQQQLTQRIASADAEYAQAEQRVRELTELVSAARKAAQIHERDWHSVETSRREIEVKRESLEERTCDEIELDLGAEYADYRAVMADGVVQRIDAPDAAARVNVLRGEINKLGPVNINAIDEEGNLTQRNEDLVTQVRDIDEARIRLATLIERLNIASRERFETVFTRIKEEFGGQGGMFRRLFGGGRAEVRLMPLIKLDSEGRKVVTDEFDMLESGIEVIAKPPGKEPRSISQLSGGEKTLTAVALLMSIFRSKPSCFCILDEVDAALDETNVGRFCDTVENFTDKSQFIIITHNKRTMRSIERLYGVTMQERGVSKRVSVRFEQIGKDGKIDPNAQPDSPAEKKPSGKLRAALAGMRDEQSQEIPVAHAPGSKIS